MCLYLMTLECFVLKRKYVLFSHIADEGGNNVVVKALVFAPEGREGICLNLTGKTLQEKNLIDL